MRLNPFAEFQITNNEIPINVKSVVQTGAKIKLGGLNDGLFNVTYQVLIADEVKNPDKQPIVNGIRRQIKSEGMYFNDFIIGIVNN